MTNGTVEQKTVTTLIPSVSIRETADAFQVLLDIPGAAKDRIKAGIENNTLSVFAELENRSGNDAPAKQYRREFSLANDVDVQSVEAEYDLGVLTVTLKKKQQYLPKQITIR
jgi:HSP20 family protein